MYSKDLKKKISNARTKGMSWNNISTVFDVPKSSCRKFFKENDEAKASKKQNNLKVKVNVEKRMKLALKDLRGNNCRITSTSLLKKSGVGLSNRTVERVLKTEGLKYLKIKREIQLCDRHKT